SFPGEKRAFIEQVAGLLALEFGKSKVFYDNYHVSELAKPNLDIHLMNLYKDDSELVVPFLCEDYAVKEWCGLEMRSIREMIKHKRDDEIMPFRFDNTTVPGFLTIDGYIAIEGRTPEDVCRLILERLKLNDDAKPMVTGDINDLQILQQKIDQLSQKFDGQLGNPELQQQLLQLTEERDLLREQLSRTEEIAEKNKKIKEELEQSLSKQKGNEELKQKAFEAVEKEDYDTAEELLKESTKDVIAEAAEGFYQLGNVKELKLEYRLALEYYEMAVKASPQNTDYLDKAGRLSRDLGYVDNAIHYLQRAIDIEEKQNALQPDLAALYNGIGLVWFSKGAYDRAIDYYEQALAIDKQHYGESHPNTAADYNNLGSVWYIKGEYDKSIEYFELALAIDREYHGELHPDIATRYNNIGNAWLSKGKYKNAIDYYEQALAIDKHHHGESHPTISPCYNNLGMAWMSIGKYDKAIVYFKRALVIDKQYFGESHPKLATRFNNLGLAWYSKGAYDKAIKYYEQSLAILKKYYGEKHPYIGSSYNNIGGVWHSKLAYDKAIDYYEQALTIEMEYYGESHPNIATDYNNLGEAWYSKGVHDKAIEYYGKAHDIFIQFLGEGHRSTKMVKANLARCIAEQDKN
ncbi:MAG TPA: tetratricopeptide repeat protein, partial [Flavipsychrobacter sp.]